jgi:hypothetical protein
MKVYFWFKKRAAIPLAPCIVYHFSAQLWILRRYDMNGRVQMQEGKNWILTKDIKCKPVLLGLSLAGNLAKPPMSHYGTEWRERGYGHWV